MGVLVKWADAQLVQHHSSRSVMIFFAVFMPPVVSGCELAYVTHQAMFTAPIAILLCALFKVLFAAYALSVHIDYVILWTAFDFHFVNAYQLNRAAGCKHI